MITELQTKRISALSQWQTFIRVLLTRRRDDNGSHFLTRGPRDPLRLVDPLDPWPVTRWPTVISDKTAPKTGWHRYETKLRHCHSVFSPHSDLVKNEGARAAADFGIDSVENLVTNRRNRFVNRYGETGNYPRQMFRWFVSSVWVYFLRLFNVCLLYLFIVLSCRIRWWNKAVRYDTIRDAILTCARKPTWVSLIYRTETTTKV